MRCYTAPAVQTHRKVRADDGYQTPDTRTGNGNTGPAVQNGMVSSDGKFRTMTDTQQTHSAALCTILPPHHTFESAKTFHHHQHPHHHQQSVARARTVRLFRFCGRFSCFIFRSVAIVCFLSRGPIVRTGTISG